MNQPKINAPAGLADIEKQVAAADKSALIETLVTLTESITDVAPKETAPSEQLPDEPADEPEDEPADETPFTAEEVIPSFWNIEAYGSGIQATHRNGRVYRGTPKQFSALLKA
jgi:hypothetical protein